MLNASIYDQCVDKTYQPSLALNHCKINTENAQSLSTLSQKKSLAKQLEDSLAAFKSHQLADLDKANLMNRVDVKFMLPITLLPQILHSLQAHYSVLSINNQRVSRYYNQYFDTSDMRFYHDHHNGKLNRYKVRQRTYLDTDTSFLEVKFKNNQKRTVKSRMVFNPADNHDDECHRFIAQEMGQSFSQLSCRQQGGYQRIALASEANAERLTLDFNLWYQGEGNSKKIDLPGFFIAELKQHKRSKQSPFYQLMSKKNIFPVSFSKYCIGCALTLKENNNIKTNQFKRILGKVDNFSFKSTLANNSTFANHIQSR